MSRLVDLCRQCIVFDSLNDLAACLETIAADQDVLIVRVKNRLHPAYDSSASGGYRDVAVNLRISCETSVEVGVDCHIGELQLILRPFAENKVIIVCFLLSLNSRECLGNGLGWPLEASTRRV